MTQKRLRLLLAETSPGEAAEALRVLYSGGEQAIDLTVVSTVGTLLPTIKVIDPEIILLDLSLDPHKPLDMVQLVHRAAPGVPLIVLADPAEKEPAARCLAEGALDFLLKGSIDAHTLQRTLRAALERNTMKGLTDLLRDPVTGLYTREGFLTVGSRRLEDTTRAGTSMVMICSLFENLRPLREVFGHNAADRAVSDLAQLMLGCCRRSDVVARLGEAQFSILGVDAVAPSAQVMRNRLLQHLAVYNKTRSPWGPIQLRTSFGSRAPHDERTFAQFLDTVESLLRTERTAMSSEGVLPRV